MFKKTFLLFLIMVFTLSACTENGIQISGNNQKLDGSGKIITENRDVSGFDKVDLQSIGNLTIVQGTEESLTIKADDNLLPYITTEVFNGTLEIGMKPNLSFNPTQSIEYELVVISRQRRFPGPTSKSNWQVQEISTWATFKAIF
jgi:hypothetical protein